MLSVLAIVAGCGGDEGAQPDSSMPSGSDAALPSISATEAPTPANPPAPDAGPPPSKAIPSYTGSSAIPSVNSMKGVHDIGHEFDVTEDGISIVDLGVWDAKADGLAAPHTVTLFSLDRPGPGATSVPVPGGSVVVPAGATTSLEDGFRFAPLAAPISLSRGHYAVVAFGLDNADPYGDGGNVPLSSTGVADASVDPHASASFRYRGPHTSFIKIMPLGASITQGVGGTKAGYRSYLHTLLEGGGIAHQFVGSSTADHGPLPADQLHHEGHPGFVIKSLASGQDGILDHVDAWLGKSGVTPDFILLLVGSNDVAGNNDLAHVGDRMDALITRISSPATGLAPKARLIVSTIPRINDATQEKRAVTYNAAIMAVAKKHADAGENVATIDAHAVVTPADKADGLHPNDSGYAKIAPLWRDAILAP